MFVEHEVEIPVPIQDVERILMRDLATWEGVGEVVYRHGEELRSKVGPERPFAKEVVLDLGQPRISHAGLAIPLKWRATGAAILFPRLTGELDAARIDSNSTRLRLRGQYDPPFGWVGDVLDSLLLQRIAQITVTDWVDRVATTLEEYAAEISRPE